MMVHLSILAVLTLAIGTPVPQNIDMVVNDNNITLPIDSTCRKATSIDAISNDTAATSWSTDSMFNSQGDGKVKGKGHSKHRDETDGTECEELAHFYNTKVGCWDKGRGNDIGKEPEVEAAASDTVIFVENSNLGTSNSTDRTDRFVDDSESDKDG
ncbi:hypothetical protein CspeluHIS016_0603330 [Cutaneotrichosporon spelunceum]|uniref:Uncharacterized protein n=1 Tax=Cutaneotrichosporon spelunceum TaxID=1672016 RepID=A0AAD3TYI3_9TREE|nr:hypothetical protein CspeluHIS016_0603330 [Cutaneotrichosporon spelunceum]